MKKIKIDEIRYEVRDEDGEVESDYDGDDFSSIKNAKKYIDDNTMGGNFTIWKVVKKRSQVKGYTKEIVPCYGGWYGGHSISKEDEENETKNPFCTRCGYRLRVYTPFGGNTKCVAIKPLVHRDDVK